MRLAILILLAILPAVGATLTVSVRAAYAAEVAVALLALVALGVTLGGRR